MSVENAIQSAKNDLLRLENQATALREQNRLLKIDVDFNIVNLERLRNEESHIEGELKSLAIAKNDHEQKKMADAEKISADRATVAEQVKIAEDTLTRSRQSHVAAAGKLAEANQKVVAAESIEKRNAEFLAGIESIKRNIEDSKSKLADGVKRLSEQQSKVEGLIALDKELSGENEATKKEIEKQRNLYQSEMVDLAAVRKENERILAEAESLKQQGIASELKASETIKAGQLSVDRQWNQIEIEKKRLEVQQLRIDKLIKDNDLHKQLEDLKGKA